MPEQRSTVNARRLARAADYLEAGRHKRAASICSRILKDEPGHIDALRLMAVLSSERGETQSGLAALKEALLRHPGNPRLADTLADLSLRTGDHQGAIGILRQALSANPGNPELELRLADALGVSGNTRQAITLYRQLLERQPGNVEARLNLGTRLMNLGEVDAALAELEHAFVLAPDTPGTAGKLAETYEQLNRVADATRLAQTGLERWPGDPQLSLVMARCLRRSGKSDEALSLLDGLRLQNAGPDDVAACQFERGTLLDRLDQPAAAMVAFSDANMLSARSWQMRRPGPNPYAQKVAHLRSAFTPELVAGWAKNAGPPADKCPVFLVGFPRSGTTLLDQVLDSHPDTQVIEERGLIAVLQHELTMRGPFPEVLAALDEAGIEALRNRYYVLAESQLALQPDRLLIDKLPLNITNAGLIFRIFPNAKFILAVRHPADVCLSCFMQNFQHTEAMANFFSLESSSEFYAAAMTLWDLYRERLPLTVHAIRYEDLIEDFSGQVDHLLEFLGLSRDASVATFHEHAKRRARINTPSYHQVSQPLYTHARFRWQRYRKQLEPYLPRLAPWINAYGYAEQLPPAAP